VLTYTAPNPWEYRLFSEWVAEGFLRFFKLVLDQESAVALGFLSFRAIQNACIFFLAFRLYNKLTGMNLLSLLGVLFLGNAFMNATFESALSFDTYFDLLFYLLAVLWILEKKYKLVIFLMIPASLNRETSGVIPFLLLAATINDPELSWSKRIAPAIAGFAIWIGIFFTLRILLPDNPLYIPYKHEPGYEILVFNIHRPDTWRQLFYTLGILPFAGLPVFYSWPLLWKKLFIILIPIWVFIHVFASLLAETRLFLVPHALFFIPTTLFALMVLYGKQDQLETLWNQ
jgi:hypothetical protein